MPHVMLLHGLLCDDSIWAPQVAGLSDLARISVPVYRSATRLEDMAELALGSVDGQIAVVGHSMGARVALEMWRAAPERITRLALLDFGVGGVVDGERAKRKVLTDLSSEKGIAALAQEWVASMVLPARRDDVSLVEPLHRMVCTYTPEQHAGHVEALLHRRDLTSLLPTITVPTLIAVGDGDPWRGVDGHRAIAAAIEDAELAVIDHCGHMAPAERPEAVTALLRSWVLGVS